MTNAIVAPFAGALIEIDEYFCLLSKCDVAPFTGAWIEMSSKEETLLAVPGRSLRGSVD